MPKVTVNGIHIYYEIHGQGEPLVDINGGGQSVDFLSVQALIPIYSRDYRFVLFDNRGAGQTEAPDISFTTQEVADDLSGLLDAIGIDSAHIRGFSMGGMIAQMFALRYPEKVRSLILACTYCGGPHSVPVTQEMLGIMDLERTQKMTPEEIARETLSIILTKEFIQKNPVLYGQLLASLTEKAREFAATFAKQKAASLNHNSYERLPEIKAPTLVIAGDSDNSIPVENSRILASRIPNAELVILKNAGHLLVEAGEEPHKVILDFLKRNSLSRKEE